MLDLQYCETEMHAAREYAKKIGMLSQLEETLEYLATYANRKGCRYDAQTGANTKCVLGKDFAPFSFSFAIFSKEANSDEYEFWFNGGLIYQGPNIPADGSFPSFTVSFEPEKIGWFIHT